MKAATGACAIAMLAFIGTARPAGAADIHVYSTGAGRKRGSFMVREKFDKGNGGMLISCERQNGNWQRNVNQALRLSKRIS